MFLIDVMYIEDMVISPLGYSATRSTILHPISVCYQRGPGLLSTLVLSIEDQTSQEDRTAHENPTTVCTSSMQFIFTCSYVVRPLLVFSDNSLLQEKETMSAITHRRKL